MAQSARILAFALSGLVLSGVASAQSAIAIDSDDIGGVVRSAKGPEAGVWVIAEVSGLPTSYVKIAVTDDQGRYVVPDLPQGTKYKVWVRGYGLIDSKAVDGTPGRQLDLTAVVAPTPAAAAEYYPAAWWYAMLRVPPASEFPGTGPRERGGNGISVKMLTQQHWMSFVKEQCMFCHQMGNKATRELEAANHIEGWDTRVRMNGTMNNHMSHFGRERGLAMFADWSKRIQDGEIPGAVPPRPQGQERNIVVTVRDWAKDDGVHDQISSDHRDPNVNAGGPIYGVSTRTGTLHIFDPKTLKSTALVTPSTIPGKANNPRAVTHAHEMDGKGRVWIASNGREGTLAPWCRDGSVASSKYYPLPDYKGGNALLPYYDPKDGKMTTIPICVGGNHGNFTFDKENIFYLSGDFDVVSWVNTRVWDETKDVKKAHGWCPMVLDTNGDGKITPDRTQWNVRGVELESAAGENTSGYSSTPSTDFDPKKDTRIVVYLYGMGVSKVDGSVWQSAYLPHVPGGIIRFHPGNNPPETCKTELYEPPLLPNGKYAAFDVRGVNVDADGVAWAALGHSIGASARC